MSMKWRHEEKPYIEIKGVKLVLTRTARNICMENPYEVMISTSDLEVAWNAWL